LVNEREDLAVRRRLLSLPLVLGFLVAFVWAGSGGADRSSSGGQKGANFAIHLTGEQERPGPGDPDGFGNAKLRVGTDNVVCYRIRVRKVERPTAAHIHVGVRGEPGPIVVPLDGTCTPTPDKGFELEGCVTDPDAAAVLADPARYYVNVHNAAFPGGAVRGQLH
jgi:CHRD domain